MRYDRIREMYAKKSLYTQAKHYLSEAYRLAVKMVESVPDEKICEMMNSTDEFAEHIWVDLLNTTVTFYNKNTEEAVDYTVGDDIPNIVKEVKELYCKLETSNLSIDSITLFMQRNGKDVKFSMDGDLSFPNLLELFNAAFGNNLVEASPLNGFTVNSEAL